MKLKKEIINDLVKHKEKEDLERIIELLLFYHNVFLNKDKSDDNLSCDCLGFADYRNYIRDLKNKKYTLAWNYLFSANLSGAFGYAIIKQSEEFLYDI